MSVAYKQGRDAWHSNKCANDCPYYEDTTSYNEWMAGYLEAAHSA